MTSLIGNFINRLGPFRSNFFSVTFTALLLILIRYLPMMFGQTLLFGDNFSLMVPGKLFTVNWLSQGILPLWNPYIFAGISWIGDINQSIFYPSTLLFFFFNPAIALNLDIIVHLLITFVAMFFLTKQYTKSNISCYLAAIIWTFSPQLTGLVNNISTLQSLSWMPVVVLAGLKINKQWGVFLLSSAVVMQLLAGYPQHIIYTLATAFILAIFEERELFIGNKKYWPWIGKWVLAILFSLGLSAFVWLPFMDTVNQSTRSIQSSSQAAAGSMELFELPKIVLPYILNNPILGLKWGPSWSSQPNIMIYVTWFGLLLIISALFNKRKTKLDWLFASIILFSIIVSFGDNFPFFKILSNLPLVSLTRGWSTILMVPMLISSIWIATCFDRFQVNKKQVKIIISFVGFIFIISLLSLMISNLSFAKIWNYINFILNQSLSNSVFHTLERDQLIVENIFINLFVNSLSLILSVWFFWKRRFLLLIVVILVEMSFNTQSHLFFAPNSVYSADFNSEVENLISNADLDNYRVITRNYNSPYTDFGAYWDAISVRQPFSDSYIDDTELTEFNHLQRMKDGLTPNWNTVQNVPLINGYTTLLPLTIFNSFIQEGGNPGINNLSQIMIDDPRLADWAVRYYLVDTWFPTYDEKFPTKLLAEESHWRLYEIDNAQGRFTDELGNYYQVNLIKDTPNQIELIVNKDEDAQYLVMADLYNNGWRASINDVPTSIENFHGKRKIKLLNDSENHIVISYWPKTFAYGLWISVSTILGILVWFCVDRLYLRKFSTQQ